MLRCSIALFFVVLVVGCGTKQGPLKAVSSVSSAPNETQQSLPEIDEGEGGLVDEQVIIVPAPQNKKYQVTPAVQSLLEQSTAKFKIGQFAQAANLLERGINISPNNPQLWQRLAIVRFKQQNYKQAKQLAVKSNVLVEGDNNVREINDRIIRRSNFFLAP